MKSWVKFFFAAIALTLVAFLLFDNCSGQDHTKVDTVFVQTIRYDTIHKTDTVFMPAKVINKLSTVVEYRVPDSLLYLINDDLGKIRIYNRQYLANNGSIINIQTNALGYMTYQAVEFADLAPIIVKTITNDRTITHKIPQHGLFVGIHALQGFGVQAHYQFKSGWQVGYQYTVIETNGANFITLSKKIL